MAMVQCKECGGEISENANTCPHCGDVIKEPKPKFSLLDLVQKISVPVVLSVAGTMITILTYFSMEGERQMEQTRKLLADAFDKDPIKQQYCIFYVDHLLASAVGVLAVPVKRAGIWIITEPDCPVLVRDARKRDSLAQEQVSCEESLVVLVAVMWALGLLLHEILQLLD
jgi:hypothetical protein